MADLENNISYKRISAKNLNQFTINDIYQIFKTVYKINKQLDYKQHTENEIIENMMHFIKNKDAELFLIYNNTQIVGDIIGRTIVNEANSFNGTLIKTKQFYISHFYVDEKQQEKQFGTKLFFRTIAEIKSKLKAKEIFVINPKNGTTHIIDKLTGNKQLSKKNTTVRNFKNKWKYIQHEEAQMYPIIKIRQHYK